MDSRLSSQLVLLAFLFTRHEFEFATPRASLAMLRAANPAHSDGCRRVSADPTSASHSQTTGSCL